MKKIISILGSTGSIGNSTLRVIDKKRKYFEINLLWAKSNYKKICYQIIKYNPKIFIVSDSKVFLKVKKKILKKKNNNIK